MNRGMVFAVNHDRKEIIKAGMNSWEKEAGLDDTASIEQRLDAFKPRVIEAREKYEACMAKFQVQELAYEIEAGALGYTRVASYWNRAVHG